MKEPACLKLSILHSHVRRVQRLATILVFALAAVSALADPAIASSHPAGILDEQLPPDPSLRRVQLANGLSAWILPNPHPEREVFISLRVESGASEDPSNLPGLAHLAEHLFFSNRAGGSGETLEERLKPFGLEAGRTMNALTTPTFTQYEFGLSGEHCDQLDEVLEILAASLDEWNVAEEDLRREREVVLREIATRAGSMLDSARKTNAALFTGTPFASVDLAGTPESVDSIQLADLARLAETAHRPGALRLFVVGDLDSDRAEKTIQRVFSQLLPRAAIVESAGSRCLPASDSPCDTVVYSSAKAQAEVLIAWPRPPLAWTVWADARRALVDELAVLALELRMEQIVSDSGDLALGSIGFQHEAPGLRFIAGMASGTDWQKMIDLILEVLPVDDRPLVDLEIDAARTVLRARLTAPTLRPESRNLLAQLMEQAETGSVFVDAEKLRSALAQLLEEVGPDEIRRAAHSFVDLENARVVLSLPSSDQKKNVGAEELRGAVQRAATARTTRVFDGGANVDTSRWDELAKPVTGNPKGGETFQIGDHLVGQTEHNSTAIRWMQSESPAGGEFALFLSLKRGTRDETATTRGCASLVAYLLGEGGSDQDRESLVRWMEQRGIHLTARATPDAIEIEMKGPHGEIDSAAALLGHLMALDSFPAMEITDRWRDHIRLTQTQQGLDPRRLITMAVRRQLSRDDLAAEPLPENRIASISIADAEAWWNEVRRSASRRIVIVTGVGDGQTSTPLDVGRWIAERFPSAKSSEVQSAKTALRPTADCLVEIDGAFDAEHSQVRLVWSAGSCDDPDQRFAWEVFAYAVDARLNDVIREELLLSYAQSARLVRSRLLDNSNLLVVDVSCLPEDAREVHRIVTESIVAQGALSPHEWRRAFDSWRANLLREVNTSAYWVDELANGLSLKNWVCRYPAIVEHPDAFSERLLESFQNPRDDRLTPLAAVALHPQKN